ncbi:VOC family protein [Nocardioides sp. R-C-SC26]|uniref:VOC family protein n=1 Tax=Nocardioides sp. R-C-SC26 TaxID=2870414 RepID=UPI001E39DC9E|nr:VOC family protein [Nocardioides sp. R-C-SC26]
MNEPFWISAFLDFSADTFEPGVAFWSAVSGYAVSPSRGDDGEFATLVPPDGDDYLRVQRLGEGATRLHVDIHVDHPRVAADAALALGATEPAGANDHGHDYVVLTSPAGLTLCFVNHPGTRRPPVARWPAGASLIDQVCLDLPPSTFDVEASFWAGVTGWPLTPASMPEFTRLHGPPTFPLRFLLQRLGDERPAGAHLDLAVSDRSAETARHLTLGADVVAVHERWTVLRDPAGSLYCLTDRSPAGSSG